jgi:NAD(P)-dependent dehydrogenase (short-subunit alcohol dehydrogenase family)
MAKPQLDIQPKFFPLEFFIQTMSQALLTLAVLRDIGISMLNLFVGRLYPSLLPRIPDADLTGKTCLITGGNSGIGLSIAKSMAERGCNVYLTSRGKEKGDSAVQEVRDYIMTLPKTVGKDGVQPRIETKALDNASFASVRRLVAELETSGSKETKINFLFLNAGFPGAESNDFTEDGHELTYQTNFLSSFLMTHLLLERRLLTDDVKIILTASTGQYGGRFSPDFQLHSTSGEVEPGFHGPPYAKVPKVPVNPSSRYANTKLMQVVFAKLLQQRFDTISTTGSEKVKPLGSRLMSAHVFTPSYCATPIFGKTDSPSPFSDPLFWFLVVSTKIAVPVEEGAATGVWLGLEEGIERGGYWDRCQRRISNVSLHIYDFQLSGQH